MAGRPPWRAPRDLRAEGPAGSADDGREPPERQREGGGAEGQPVIFKIAAAIAVLALMRLVDHAYADYSAGAAEMVVKAGILGATIVGLFALDIMRVPKSVEKK